MEWPLILVPLVYLLTTPYTKVEESFNIQAVHDVLFHQGNITGYDHLEFPGVVPRTFIGPLLLAILAGPFVFLTEKLEIGSHFFAQYIVRTVLCLCVTVSLIRLKRTLQANLGARWGWWFVLVTASQYHLLYYSSRPLPNILALPLVLLAVAAAFSPKDNKSFLVLSGAAIIWFRAELAILLGILLAIQIVSGKMSIVEVVKTTVPTGIALIAVTTLIDSFFWQRLVWPEAEVFYFNTILNKSSDWGTSPFLWYFYSALPRGLGTSLFLIPIGIYYENRVRRLVFAATAFILLFSFLPHKELRFIIYTFPLLNTAVAAACHKLWENRNKSLFRWLLGVGVIGHLIFNMTFTIFLLMVARVNYPGGEAIARLHQLIPNETFVNVHIGNLAAQTGVSRFTQLNDNWSYSKEENLEPGSPKMLQFTHLLIEAKSKYSPNLKPYAKTHQILASVDGFAEVTMNHQMFPPVRIKTKPLIFIMARNPDIIIPEIEKEMPEKERADMEYDEKFVQQPDEAKMEEPNVEFTPENLSFAKRVQQPDEPEMEDPTENSSFEAISDEKTDPPTEYSPPVKKEVTSDDQAELVPQTQHNENEYEAEDEDDLLATESKERLVESFDYQLTVKDLEERLKFNTGNIDEALLNDDVISYIQALTNVDYNGPQDIGKLKEALSSILHGFKRDIDSTKRTTILDDSGDQLA